jgi:hypothetical protein
VTPLEIGRDPLTWFLTPLLCVTTHPSWRERLIEQYDELDDPRPPAGAGIEATTAADSVYRVSGFRDGLKEAGFIDESSRAPPAFGWRARQKQSRPVLEAG